MSISEAMKERIDGFRKAAKYGKENGKKNMIVDIDILEVLLGDGHQNLTIDELTERFYLVRSHRATLLAAIEKIRPYIYAWRRGENADTAMQAVERFCREAADYVLFGDKLPAQAEAANHVGS